MPELRQTSSMPWSLCLSFTCLSGKIGLLQHCCETVYIGLSPSHTPSLSCDAAVGVYEEAFV